MFDYDRFLCMDNIKNNNRKCQADGKVLVTKLKRVDIHEFHLETNNQMYLITKISLIDGLK